MKKYKKLSETEHVLTRPGMYLGNISNTTKKVYCYTEEGMVKREVAWNPALFKMFDEVLVNSVDAAKHMKQLATIKIDISQKTGEIVVFDNIGIPVEIDEKIKNKYIPECIFSEMRYGSNFEDGNNNDLTGMHGLGVKLTNIFSKKFEVSTSDGKKQFYQVFKNNMSERSEPEITKTKSKGTSIAWLPDYDRLGTEPAGGNYDKMVKRTHDIAACNPKLKIYLNGERVKYTSFKTYIAEFTSEFVYGQNDDWQVGVAASDDGFQHVSFVNSTETMVGGNHVEYITKQITEKLRDVIKKKHKVDVKPAAIRNHLMLFINARIINPRYPSQTKEDLITEIKDFGTEFEVSDKMISDIVKGNIIQSILDWVSSKQRQEELAKLRKASKNNKNKKVPTHIKANSKNREDTILLLTEGESAAANFLNVRDQKKHGMFPLKGKPLNWRKAKNLADVATNVEFSSIMSILGLEFGKKATLLNYGKIRYSTDADLDGAGSIVGLLNNFFSLWPELFEQKKIELLRSPIIIAKKKGQETTYFYNLKDWEKVSSKYSSWNIKYVKGLGGLTEDEYDFMINHPKYETVTLDKDGLDSLEMAFGTDVTGRKTWLTN